MDYPTFDKIELFLSKTGQKGSDLLSVLGKQVSFIQAYDSEVGQQLLKDVIALMEHHLEAIIEEKATPEERAEFRVLRKILFKWSERINAYRANVDKINRVK